MEGQELAVLTLRTNERKEVIYQTGESEDPESDTQNKLDSVQSDNASRVAELTAGTTAIGLLGMGLIASTLLIFLVSFFAPLVANNTGLALSLVVQHEWRQCLAHVNDTDYLNKCIKTINDYEDTRNFLLIVTEFGVTFWDLCLGVLYLLFDLFINLCVLFFKLVFTDPVRAAFIWLVRTLATLAVSLIQALTPNFGIAQEHSMAMKEPGLDPGETFGASTGTMSESSSKDNAQKGYILFNGILTIFAFFDTKSFGEMVDWLVDPFFRTIKDWFKVIANFAALVGKSGLWSKIFSGDSYRRQAESVLGASECVFDKVIYNAQCTGQKMLYYLGELVADIGCLGTCSNPAASMACDYQKISGCHVDNAFAGAASNPDNSFGSGFCDEIECEYFVSDLYTTFAQINNTCSFWVYSPNAVYTCMQMVNSYVNINDTSTSVANPASLASEICIVSMAQNLKSCESFGVPFQFNFDTAAVDVCSNTALGADFSSCSCVFKAPLCDATCCQSYAQHVNLQTLAQISDTTCAQLYTFFPKDSVWCPLLGNVSAADPPFPDNTYTHMWCSYYMNVLNALCEFAAPFTRIGDLNIDSVLAAYADQACNATVNQVGVCLPVNATIDNLANSVISFSQPGISVFDANDAETYVPGTPIITNFDVNDDASSIYDKARKKHFCQQFSLINKNDNLLLKSQPWLVKSGASVFCDTQVINARKDVNLFASTTYKYLQPNGDPLSVQLEGLGNNFAFGDAVDPNLSGPGGVCMGSVGANLNEQKLQDVCVNQLRMDASNIDANIIMDQTAMQGVFQSQQANSDRFAFVTGLVPVDPNNPNAVEMNIEIQRTDTVLNLDTDVVQTPYNELSNVTNEWRVNYTNPPPDGSIDEHNPGAAFGSHFTRDLGPTTGRFLLSVDPITKKVPAPQYHKDLLDIFYNAFPTWRPTTTITKQHKINHANEYKLRRRVLKMGEDLHEKYYGKYKKQYAEAGFDVDNDVDYFTQTRKLLMTGDPVVDSQITAVFDVFANVPHSPLILTRQEFSTMLELHVKDNLVKMAKATGTLVAPKIFAALFNFANAETIAGLNVSMGLYVNISTYDYEVFGQTQEPLKCAATMQDPYRSCRAASTPYECCCGLIGCIFDVPESWYATRTTRENFERWRCREVDHFFGWWTWLFRIVISVTASILSRVLKITAANQFIIHHVPDNLDSCMLVNLPYLFIGIDILFALYFFFTVQVITLWSVLFANFRRDQAVRDDELSRQIDTSKKRDKENKQFKFITQ